MNLRTLTGAAMMALAFAAAVRAEEPTTPTDDTYGQPVDGPHNDAFWRGIDWNARRKEMSGKILEESFYLAVIQKALDEYIGSPRPSPNENKLRPDPDRAKVARAAELLRDWQQGKVPPDDADKADRFIPRLFDDLLMAYLEQGESPQDARAMAVELAEAFRGQAQQLHCRAAVDRLDRDLLLAASGGKDIGKRGIERAKAVAAKIAAGEPHATGDTALDRIVDDLMADCDTGGYKELRAHVAALIDERADWCQMAHDSFGEWNCP